jgi:hypothetical protein
LVTRVVLGMAAVAAALGVTPAAHAWSWPTDGRVLRPFVFGENPYAAGLHRGVDVAGDPGTSVQAPAGGTVAFAGTVPGGGRSVTIETLDGYSVTLVHLGSTGVLKGAVVSEGDAVGTIGPSGEAEVDEPYVHLGVRVSAEPEGYVDPLALLPQRRTEPARTEQAPGAPAQVVPEERGTPPAAEAKTAADGQAVEVSVGSGLQPPAAPLPAVADEPAVETSTGAAVEEATHPEAAADSPLRVAGDSAESAAAEAGAVAVPAAGSGEAGQPLAGVELRPGETTSVEQREEDASQSPVATVSSSAGGGAPPLVSEPSAAVIPETTATGPSVTSGEGADAAPAPILASPANRAQQAGTSLAVPVSGTTAAPAVEPEGSPLAASPDDVPRPNPRTTPVGPDGAAQALLAEGSGGPRLHVTDAGRRAGTPRRHSATNDAADPTPAGRSGADARRRGSAASGGTMRPVPTPAHPPVARRAGAHRNSLPASRVALAAAGAGTRSGHAAVWSWDKAFAHAVWLALVAAALLALVVALRRRLGKEGTRAATGSPPLSPETATAGTSQACEASWEEILVGLGVRTTPSCPIARWARKRATAVCRRRTAGAIAGGARPSRCTRSPRAAVVVRRRRRRRTPDALVG